MILVNAVFYGVLAYIALYILKGGTSKDELETYSDAKDQRPKTNDQRPLL
jgi:hypothetical protein